MPLLVRFGIIPIQFFTKNRSSNENDDSRPKIWYKYDQIGGSPHEVELGMNNDKTQNRIHLNNEHGLIINNMTENDTGLYYCKRLDEELEEEKYNYLVDCKFLFERFILT